jgi:AraC-like DNA-binding protein
MLGKSDFPILQDTPFKWMGISRLLPPYRIVRRHSVHSHVVVCLAGEGRTLINNQVVTWGPGQVLLAPVGQHHAFEVKGSRPWEIAWVFFDDHPGAPALTGTTQLVDAHDEGFPSLLRLLVDEAAGPAEPGVMAALTEALPVLVRRVTGSEQGDPRLRRLWAQVESHLAHPWTLAELARRSHVSEEHLRRLCHRHLQRSPAEHLTHLRMRRASTLLRATSGKLEVIAEQVGYGSVYAFATAFKRWSGQPPARFRRAA